MTEGESPSIARSGGGDRLAATLHGKRAIPPQMSMRFGVFFGQSPEYWHGLQVECDFRALKKQAKEITKGIVPAGK